MANEACRAELAIIISYPKSVSGIIVLLKMPTKYQEIFPTLFIKSTDFQLFFNFEQTRTVTIFEDRGIKAHIPRMAKPIRALKLQQIRPAAYLTKRCIIEG